MELTFGTAQIHTSERLKNRPGLAKLFHKIFGYTNVGNYARFTVFKKLLRHTHSIENGKILDLGTGYGEYAISLASAYPNACVHALDINAERIAAVKRATKKLELNNIDTHCKPIDLSLIHISWPIAIPIALMAMAYGIMMSKREMKEESKAKQGNHEK